MGTQYLRQLYHHQNRIFKEHCLCPDSLSFGQPRLQDWAKRENIAAASDGTLSSYSWTILVLHYLQNRRSGAAASLGEAKDAPLCEIPVLPCLQDPAMLEAWRAAGAPGAGKDALMGQRGDNINVGLKSNSAWPE